LSQTGLLLDHFISLQRKSTGREGRVISIHQLCKVKYTLRGGGGLGQGYFTAVVVMSVSDKQSPTETSHVALKVSCDLNKWRMHVIFKRKDNFGELFLVILEGENGVVYNILVGAAEQ